MPLVDSLDDPRLAPYRNLKDHELARDGARFVAEGEQVVRRLLASGLAVESLLVSTRKADEMIPIVPPNIPVYVAPDDQIQRIIGFEFHSGVLAVGVRPKSANLEHIVSRSASALTFIVCPNITNTRNLGALVRLCAAFNVHAMILGENCCDPFFRMSVRISMGSVFKLPIVRCSNLMQSLEYLRNNRFDLVASVIDPTAEPLAAAARPPRLAILLGNEADGLAPAHISACQRRVTIPMRMGTDSLNVAIAAGIFLYHFVDRYELDQAVKSNPDSPSASSCSGE